jgi:hypothetical protein
MPNSAMASVKMPRGKFWVMSAKNAEPIKSESGAERSISWNAGDTISSWSDLSALK